MAVFRHGPVHLMKRAFAARDRGRPVAQVTSHMSVLGTKGDREEDLVTNRTF